MGATRSQGGTVPDFRYKAFISYSWADAAWGKWLHHAIETYRTPRQLIGEGGLHGPVPARLVPLFKDREDMPPIPQRQAIWLKPHYQWTSRRLPSS